MAATPRPAASTPRKPAAAGADAPYYYAGGQRVWLEPDAAHVAVHGALPRTAPAPAPRGIGAAKPRDLGDGVLLLPAAAAPDGAARLPVFRSGRTLLVARPEVRVEDDDAVHLAQLRRWLAEAPDALEIVEDRPGHLTLRAGPALGHDGVALARELVERCGIASASPRLLRVTPGSKR